jgi:carboxymethylenebutenolidase
MSTERGWSRRGFGAAALAAGIVGRHAAAESITSPVGLEIGSIDIPVYPGGPMKAYHAQPTVFDRSPVLVLIEDERGLSPHLEEMCRRFAKKGFLAVAPDLYFRLADPASMPNAAERAALLDLSPDEKMMADLDCTVAWVTKFHRGDVGRVSVIGWGDGGRLAWLYAARNATLKSMISLYGPVSGRKTANHPMQPLDIADKVMAPALALYGGADPATPSGDIDRILTKLRSSGVECKFFVYPSAGHFFDIEETPRFDAGVADDAFERSLAWLRSHGMW